MYTEFDYEHYYETQKQSLQTVRSNDIQAIIDGLNDSSYSPEKLREQLILLSEKLDSIISDGIELKKKEYNWLITFDLRSGTSQEYVALKKYFIASGFLPKNDSDYVSREPLSETRISAIEDRAFKEFPWLKEKATKMYSTVLTGRGEITDKFRQANILDRQLEKAGVQNRNESFKAKQSYRETDGYLVDGQRYRTLAEVGETFAINYESLKYHIHQKGETCQEAVDHFKNKKNVAERTRSSRPKTERKPAPDIRKELTDEEKTYIDTHTLSETAKHFGLTGQAISQRMKLQSETISEAVSHFLGMKERYQVFGQNYTTIGEVSRAYGVSSGNLYNYIGKGLTCQEAVEYCLSHNRNSRYQAENDVSLDEEQEYDR